MISRRKGFNTSVSSARRMCCCRCLEIRILRLLEMETERHALQHGDIESCSIKASSMHALEEYRSSAQT
jgi:hypothetical protein